MVSFLNLYFGCAGALLLGVGFSLALASGGCSPVAALLGLLIVVTSLVAGHGP